MTITCKEAGKRAFHLFGQKLEEIIKLAPSKTSLKPEIGTGYVFDFNGEVWVQMTSCKGWLKKYDTHMSVTNYNMCDQKIHFSISKFSGNYKITFGLSARVMEILTENSQCIGAFFYIPSGMESEALMLNLIFQSLTGEDLFWIDYQNEDLKKRQRELVDWLNCPLY